MAKRMIEGIEIETSLGNVFADLGLPGAEKLKIKSCLVIEISPAVRRLGLTQESSVCRGSFIDIDQFMLEGCLIEGSWWQVYEQAHTIHKPTKNQQHAPVGRHDVALSLLRAGMSTAEPLD